MSEIADKEHLSIYYLSHIIKEAPGLSFQDLLSYIRVEESEKLLLGTNKKIGAIADETGFSAVRYYIKHFEQWFGMHPLEYRKKYIGKIISREIEAKYERVSPAQIEDAIRKQVKGVYADYADKLKTPPVIVDIDIYDDYAALQKEPPALKEIMERGVNATLAEPYMKLMEMKEGIITSGDNYIISTKNKYPGALDSLSILVYNFDANVIRSLKRINSYEELMRISRNYDNEMEFLVRATGLSGNFRIIRYRLEKDSIMSRVKEMIDPGMKTDVREAFINKLITEANVTTGSYTSSDALSVRTTFKGIGAELVLIDKI